MASNYIVNFNQTTQREPPSRALTISGENFTERKKKYGKFQFVMLLSKKKNTKKSGKEGCREGANKKKRGGGGGDIDIKTGQSCMCTDCNSLL